MNFLVSCTYDETTEESAAEGCTSGNGFVYQNTVMDLSETVQQLQRCHELSTMPVRSPLDLSGREWASTEEEVNFLTGETRIESIHIRTIQGTPLSPRNLYRLYKLAGLTQ